jgi:hypothetical protein
MFIITTHLQYFGLKFAAFVCRRQTKTAFHIHVLFVMKGTKFIHRRCSYTKYFRMCKNGCRLSLWYTFIRRITFACPIRHRNYMFTSSSPTLDSWFFFESRNRPGVAQRVPGRSGSQISWHSAREGGEVVSPTHRPPLPPGMFVVLIFTWGWVDPRAMVRSEGNMSLKNPVTPPGIDHGTVRLVAQRLNHYATPGPTHVLLNHYSNSNHKLTPGTHI